MTDTLFLLNQGTKPGLSSNCFLFNGRLSAYIAERCLCFCIWYGVHLQHPIKTKVLAFLSHRWVDFISPRWGREMLKSGGENGTSFLNSREVKSVLSAFYFWRVASKFQEMGGVLVFSLGNTFSSLRILIPSDENYFPSLGILFSSLAISFSSDGIYISSDVFSIICRDFFTKVRSFPLKEGKSRKKRGKILRKHQEVARFKSSENRLFPTNSFGVANGVLN